MLTADLVRPRLRRRGANLNVTLLKANKAWLQTAQELIDLFQQQVGQPQQVWHDALEAYEGVRTDYIPIRGLAKVLEDEATFTPLETSIDPTDLRQKLFAHGPAFGKTDLFNTRTRNDVVAEVAVELGVSTAQI